MKDIEQKQMLGQRQSDDDGFGYRYGAHKGGYVKRPRHNNSIATCRRADKRSVRAASTRRALAESV